MEGTPGFYYSGDTVVVYTQRMLNLLVDYQDCHQATPMSDMYNPPHPGETLRDDVLPALGLTVTEAARQLGVTRAALSRVLNGRAAISPDMAAWRHGSALSAADGRSYGLRSRWTTTFGKRGKSHGRRSRASRRVKPRLFLKLVVFS